MVTLVRHPGGTNRTNTGGPAASFGIWAENNNTEDLQEMLDICREYHLNIKRVHSHIGSGSNPEVWKKVAGMTLNRVDYLMEKGHDVKIINLGGGFKVARMPNEKSADLTGCGESISELFHEFYNNILTPLHLEIEPGTALVANAGNLVSRVIDVKSTSGYKFIIIDSGMTEVTRPSLYGAQHPMWIVPIDGSRRNKENYVVCGHCCESGDIWTPAPGDSEGLQPRTMLEAKVGDLLVIGGVGAYCSSMSTKNYNSYPEAAEVLIDYDGKPLLIRERQSLGEMTQNERIVID